MENVSQSLSRALSERGHEVSVVTASAGRGSRVWEGGILVRRCAAVEVARTPIAPGMPARLGLLKADVMHVHISQAFVPEVASMVSAVTRVPIVAHFHMDVPATRHKKVFDGYKRYVLGPMLRRAHAIAVLSAEQKQFLEETYGVADHAVVVVPNGTDARFRPALERKARHDRRRLLFVGRLSPQKNVGRLLRACARLPFPYRLTICGDGVERASLEAEARRLGLTSVAFRGMLSPEQLLSEYHGSDLLVSSSDHEGMPLAVLEAMATGLPVVATDVPGNRETVGGTGVLTPATDAGLAQGLTAVLEDEKLWLDLGARSRRAAAGRGWPEAAGALERLFVAATGGARGPGSLEK
jgi:glycosyltransferase involved in cell wall biosynthesis